MSSGMSMFLLYFIVLYCMYCIVFYCILQEVLKIKTNNSLFVIV